MAEIVKKPRWRFEVLSPVDKSVIWSFSAFKANQIVNKWYQDTGNKFLSSAKVVRATTGYNHNPFIRCYKVGKWAEGEKEVTTPSSPTPSDMSFISTVSDYSTTYETDTDIETDIDSDGTVE